MNGFSVGASARRCVPDLARQFGGERRRSGAGDVGNEVSSAGRSAIPTAATSARASMVSMRSGSLAARVCERDRCGYRSDGTNAVASESPVPTRSPTLVNRRRERGRGGQRQPVPTGLSPLVSRRCQRDRDGQRSPVPTGSSPLVNRQRQWVATASESPVLTRPRWPAIASANGIVPASESPVPVGTSPLVNRHCQWDGRR